MPALRSVNRKLLVSVFDAQEAREAVMGGGRIIDSEDPRSALGNIKPRQIMAISDAVLNYQRDLDVQLSTNIGEDQLLFDRAEDGQAIEKSPYEIAGKAAQAAIGVACAMGMRVHPCNLVKVGVDGMPVDLVGEVLDEVVVTLNRTEALSHCQVMAVLFAQDLDLWDERKRHPSVRGPLVRIREFHPWDAAGPVPPEDAFDLRDHAIDNLRDGKGLLLFPSTERHGRDQFASEALWKAHWDRAVSRQVPLGTTYGSAADIPVARLEELRLIRSASSSPMIALNELFPHGAYFEVPRDLRKTNEAVITAMVDAAADAGADAIMIDTQIQTKVARICFLGTDSEGLVDINRLDRGPKGDRLPKRGILSLDTARFFVEYCHHKGIEANIAGSVESYHAQQLWRAIPHLDQVSTRGAASAVPLDPFGRPLGQDTREERKIVRSLVQGLAPPELDGVINLPDFMSADPEAAPAIAELRKRYPDCPIRFVDVHGRVVPGAAPTGPQTAVQVLGQKNRPQCSLGLTDADLTRGDANWQKGLQAQSDWTWSGNLVPGPFPNNLARFFLKIPGLFERQLHFSTALIFDEPSFRNGIQMSGFVDRQLKELVINYIAQKRRCWYSMTHHAVLARRTADRCGTDPDLLARKLSALLSFDAPDSPFSDLERRVLRFAEAYVTDPRTCTTQDVRELRAAFARANQEAFAALERPQLQREAARSAYGQAMAQADWPADPDRGTAETPPARSAADAVAAAHAASAAVGDRMPADMLERKINGQLAELGLLCMQFVALTGVLTGLNIPDEDFLPGIMQQQLSPAVIETINALNQAGPVGMDCPVPSAPDLPLQPILDGLVRVESAPLRRKPGEEDLPVPLSSYELMTGLNDLDLGITQGGCAVASWGWGLGMHFPGGLVHLIRHLPEVGRLEADYSLPLIFTEDQTRNGEPTAGFVDRVIKELIIQKVYRLVCCRYGLEHHALYCYNAHRRAFMGPRLYAQFMADRALAGPAAEQANAAALEECTRKLLRLHEHAEHPQAFSPLENAVFTWVEALVCCPHSAHHDEAAVRSALAQQNRDEIAAGTRLLHRRAGQSDEAALQELIDSQIAEMAMLACHFDGLGRAMSILQLHGEDAVESARVSADGALTLTGYHNPRPDFLALCQYLEVHAKVRALHELLCNPPLLAEVRRRLGGGEAPIVVSAATAAETAQF